MRRSIGLFASAMVLSALLHVAALIFSILGGHARPFDARPTESVVVDIVRPEEVPQTTPEPAGPALTKLEPANAPPAKPEPAKAPPTKTEPAKAPPTKSAAAEPPPPQPATTASNQSPFDPGKLAAMFPVSPVGGSFDGKPMPEGTTQSNGFDAPADKAANLSAADIAAFKAHLRKCWSLPSGLSAAEKLRIVVRLSLKPDGELRAQPILLEASASPNGPALVQSVLTALSQCQPYNFLPADKYAEWKILDVSLSPRDTGG
jgi:hypothetical protein